MTDTVHEEYLEWYLVQPEIIFPEDAWQAAHARYAPRWTEVGSEFNVPHIGAIVLLIRNGILQNETYELDQGDNGMGGGEYFWNRDGLDECPPVIESDKWMLLRATKEPQS